MPRLRAAGEAFALLSLLAGMAAAAGPLPLRAPPLLVPEETAGFGIAPEVGVRLSIDERGAVRKVEVLSIAPASDFDEIFRSTVIETLSNWRFAPATEGGKAKPSTLEWKVQFPAKAAELRQTIEVASRLVGANAEERRAAVMALPQSQRRQMLAEQTVTAIRHLDARKTIEFASPRFVVRSDADNERTASLIAGNLESIFNLLAGDLLPGIALQPEPYKIQVVVYRSRAQYSALSAEIIPFESSTGYYSPAGLIAFHLEQPTSEYVLSTLLHEATHAFIDRHIVRPGVALPRWLGEGFAEYVGNSAIQRGRLQPGKTLVHKYTIEQGRTLSVETTAGARLDDARTAIQRGKGIGVEQMLEASPEIFYGEGRRLYYATSWLLVHFLRDGAGASTEGQFSRLLLYLAEGYPEKAAFRAVYGETAAAEPAFRQYVKKF